MGSGSRKSRRLSPHANTSPTAKERWGRLDSPLFCQGAEAQRGGTAPFASFFPADLSELLFFDLIEVDPYTLPTPPLSAAPECLGFSLGSEAEDPEVTGKKPREESGSLPAEEEGRSGGQEATDPRTGGGSMERGGGGETGERVLLCEWFEERIENVLEKSRVSSDGSSPFRQDIHSRPSFLFQVYWRCISFCSDVF